MRIARLIGHSSGPIAGTRSRAHPPRPPAAPPLPRLAPMALTLPRAGELWPRYPPGSSTLSASLHVTQLSALRYGDPRGLTGTWEQLDPWSATKCMVAHGSSRPAPAQRSTIVGGREGAASRRSGPPERREAGQGREADPRGSRPVLSLSRANRRTSRKSDEDNC